MDAVEFDERKQALMEECVVAQDVFQQVEPRLEAFLEPFVESLVRKEQVAHVRTFVSGLLSDLTHRNVESIAYRFGQERLPLQHFIGMSAWNDCALRDELGRQIGVELGEPDGVLVFDPSGFPKSGRESVGVARQWCGRLGKVDNCQVALFLGYVTRVEHALVDTRLYLPKEWTQDKKRLAKAGVPKGTKYRTRHQLALEMLAERGGQLPHAWITGDDEMGRPAWFRRSLRELDERYLLAVPSNTLIRDLAVEPPAGTGFGRPPQRPWQRVADWTQAQPDSAWITVDVRDGSKGPLVVELLTTRVKARDGKQRASDDEETLVVIRYRDREAREVTKIDYYLSNASTDTAPAEFARVAKAEHRIEECLERAKSEAGLADYEVRNWVGWRHHQTLSLIATWFLVQETRRGKKIDPGHHAAADSRRHFPHSPPRLGSRYSLAPRKRRPTPPRTQRTGSPLSLENP